MQKQADDVQLGDFGLSWQEKAYYFWQKKEKPADLATGTLLYRSPVRPLSATFRRQSKNSRIGTMA